jgi:hypothetical protein
MEKIDNNRRSGKDRRAKTRYYFGTDKGERRNSLPGKKMRPEAAT